MNSIGAAPTMPVRGRFGRRVDSLKGKASRAAKAAVKYTVNSTIRNTDFIVPTSLWFCLGLSEALDVTPPFSLTWTKDMDPAAKTAFLFPYISAGTSILASLLKTTFDFKERLFVRSHNLGLSFIRSGFLALFGIGGAYIGHYGFGIDYSYGALITMTMVTLIPGFSNR